MMLVQDKKARYKVEVGVMEDNNEHGNPGRIAIVKSASAMDGHGDEPCFFCPYCNGLIDPDNTEGPIFVCSSCGVKGESQYLGEAFMFRANNQKIAKLIHTLLQKVKFDADVYLRRFKKPLGTATQIALDNWNLDKVVKATDTARTSRELVIYPMKNMVRDNIGGSDMIKKLEVFLRA